MMHIPFGLIELASYSMGIAFAKKTPYAIGFSLFDVATFKQEKVSLSIAKKWGALSIGLGISALRRSTEVRQFFGWSWEFGAILHLNSQLLIGLHVLNPAAQKIGAARLGGLHLLGVQYQAVDFLKLLIELGRTDYQPITIKCGLEAQLHEVLALRTGFDFSVHSLTGGLGIKEGRWIFTYGTAWHTNLGFSHRWEIGYTW